MGMGQWRGMALVGSLLVGCGGSSMGGNQGTEPPQDSTPTGGTETPAPSADTPAVGDGTGDQTNPNPGTGGNTTPGTGTGGSADPTPPPEQATAHRLTSFYPPDPNEPDNWASYFPQYLTAGRDKLYFAINYDVVALWMSDGTAQGTAVVKNFTSDVKGLNFISELTAVDKQVFFVADRAPNGNQLWVSNGTSKGTQPVKTLAGAPWGDPSAQHNYGSVALGKSLLFFQFYPDTSTTPKHTELWKSDGTASGTVLLKDLGVNSTVGERLVVGNTFYFTAYERNSGTELWKSDGTAAGTQLVRDITPGVDSSNPSDFRTDGTLLYFTATVNSHKTLWKSDGSEAHTVLLYNFEQDPTEAPMSPMTLAGHTLCLNALGDDHLLRLYAVKLDGPVPVHRQLIATLPNASAQDFDETGAPSIPEFTTAGGKVFFSQYVPYRQTPRDVQLWVTDGTSGGTQLLMHPMSMSDEFLYPEIAALGNRVITGGDSNNDGIEPWVSDGTVTGTRELLNIETGDGGSSMPRFFTPMGDSMFFVAYDSQHGNSLWVFKP